MPGQIKNSVTDELASNEEWDKSSPGVEIQTKISRLCDNKNAIQEEEEHESETPKESEAGSTSTSNGVANIKVPTVVNKYIWRIDLKQTEPYWTGWFKGLSQKFLELQAPKVLLLANIHGLDTSLTVGQMQGKFQLQVLSRSGHAIHEDQPHQVADIIASFLVKQKLAAAKHNFTTIMPAC